MEQKIDPLRRVFVHNGQRFQTHDGIYYYRQVGDTIYRSIKKARGKSARRADKKARHEHR